MDASRLTRNHQRKIKGSGDGGKQRRSGCRIWGGSGKKCREETSIVVIPLHEACLIVRLSDDDILDGVEHDCNILRIRCPSVHAPRHTRDNVSSACRQKAEREEEELVKEYLPLPRVLGWNVRRTTRRGRRRRRRRRSDVCVGVCV
jgi:hypothetical protein